MTPTAVAHAPTAERPAMGKTGMAKAKEQSPGQPGQFAALLLQADDEPAPVPVGDASAPQTEAADKDSKDNHTADSDAPAGTDAAQRMLLAMMGWRSVSAGNATPGAATTLANNGTPALPSTTATSLETDLAAAASSTWALLTQPGASAPALSTNTAANAATATAVATDAALAADAAKPQPPGASAVFPSGAERLAGAAARADAKATEVASARPPLTEAGTAQAQTQAQEQTTSATPPQAQAPAQTPAQDNATASILSAKGKAVATKATGAGQTRANNAPSTEAVSSTTPNAAAKPADTVAHVRSTVELAARTPAPDGDTEALTAAASDALEPTAVLAPFSAQTPSGDGMPQADAGRAELAPTAASADKGAGTETFASQFHQHMDEVGSHISYWASQGAQRATFTVGSAQDMPVEVTMSFSDGNLNVAFETQETSVRELLEAQAPTALQQLMEAQGISLGSVSVNGERPRSQQDNPSNTPTVTWAQRGGAPRNADAGAGVTAPTARRAPQIMTATQLDFYA